MQQYISSNQVGKKDIWLDSPERHIPHLYHPVILQEKHTLKTAISCPATKQQATGKVQGTKHKIWHQAKCTLCGFCGMSFDSS